MKRGFMMNKVSKVFVASSLLVSAVVTPSILPESVNHHLVETSQAAEENTQFTKVSILVDGVEKYHGTLYLPIGQTYTNKQLADLISFSGTISEPNKQVTIQEDDFGYDVSINGTLTEKQIHGEQPLHQLVRVKEVQPDGSVVSDAYTVEITKLEKGKTYTYAQILQIRGSQETAVEPNKTVTVDEDLEALSINVIDDIGKREATYFHFVDQNGKKYKVTDFLVPGQTISHKYVMNEHFYALKDDLGYKHFTLNNPNATVTSEKHGTFEIPITVTEDYAINHYYSFDSADGKGNITEDNKSPDATAPVIDGFIIEDGFSSTLNSNQKGQTKFYNYIKYSGNNDAPVEDKTPQAGEEVNVKFTVIPGEGVTTFKKQTKEITVKRGETYTQQQLIDMIGITTPEGYNSGDNTVYIPESVQEGQELSLTIYYIENGLPEESSTEENTTEEVTTEEKTTEEKTTEEKTTEEKTTEEATTEEKTTEENTTEEVTTEEKTTEENKSVEPKTEVKDTVVEQKVESIQAKTTEEETTEVVKTVKKERKEQKSEEKASVKELPATGDASQTTTLFAAVLSLIVGIGLFARCKVQK